MKNVLLLFILFLSIDTSLSAQTKFFKSYSNGSDTTYAFQSVVQTQDDSVYYVTGWSDANSESVRLMKLDSAGNELWRRDYGGSSTKQGYALAITKDEKIYCGGQHVWGSSSGYMVKTDKNGDTIWTRTYANINDVRSIVAHDDGNFSIVGFAVDTVSRGYLALCDSNGIMLWKKDFDDTAMTWARSHTTTKEGGYIIGGISWLQGYDLAIIKTDGAGNLLWNKRYDYHHDYGYEIIQTSDNGFVLCGESGNNGIEAILLKTDSAGNSTNITTNISLVERKKIELYPNPAHDKISLSYEGNLKIRSIALYDLSGKCVRKYDPTQKQLSVEGLSTGIYLLKIQSDQQHFVEKLMIE